MQKRMLVLVNPNAGRSGYKTVLGDVLKVFSDGGWTPSVCFTRRQGEAPELVRRDAADYDLVTCLGGDGTLSEVCAGMMRLGPFKRPIGYIPLGTANDMAHTLGLSAKPTEAARQILTGKPRPYDIGRFGTDEYFSYVAAFGAFTEVSYATPQESKQALGHMAYMLEALRELPKLKDYPAVVEYDGGAAEDSFIFGAVMNTTSMGGVLRLGDGDVSLSDGLFEVLLVRRPQDILELSDVIGSVLSNDYSSPGVLYLKSREVRVSFRENVPWTRDGEDGGSHRNVVIANCHPGVEIIV